MTATDIKRLDRKGSSTLTSFAVYCKVGRTSAVRISMSSQQSNRNCHHMTDVSSGDREYVRVARAITTFWERLVLYIYV